MGLLYLFILYVIVYFYTVGVIRVHYAEMSMQTLHDVLRGTTVANDFVTIAKI